jgi:phosphatidylserine synthase
MSVHSNINPWWAAITVWIIVNAVNLLQASGFLSRIAKRSMSINHILGYIIIALAVPAAVALAAFLHAKTDWRQWIGLVVFIAFVILMVCIEYLWPVEFRSPMRVEILVPYLLLFFGSILLMGLPMFRINWYLWLVTVATTVLLLISMVIAMRKGVG